jgi:hypothetical protein
MAKRKGTPKKDKQWSTMHNIESKDLHKPSVNSGAPEVPTIPVIVLVIKLKSSLQKFYRRHYDLRNRYGIYQRDIQ